MFVIDTAIRGHHVYQDIWPSQVVEEQLQCECEVGRKLLHSTLLLMQG